ncbi:hypothetical protein [Aeromonas piscicola]|uniref:hypothetical protein n=1 Tax=Aeromonas piscicola TaxID=600645 RepID=UPI0028EAB28B|nr:hypothetical protein [Aeromonas piscicola]
MLEMEMLCFPSGSFALCDFPAERFSAGVADRRIAFVSDPAGRQSVSKRGNEKRVLTGGESLVRESPMGAKKFALAHRIGRPDWAGTGPYGLILATFAVAAPA